MEIVKKIFLLALSVFLLFLTVSIPDINTVMLLDISKLSNADRVLLQYSTLIAFSGTLIWMALMDGDDD